MIINGIDMPNFTVGEFPENPRLADSELLIAIQGYRDKLNNVFHISQAAGALARVTGRLTSKHRVRIKDGKLSTAIDGFPEGDIFKAWVIAINCGLWGGVGVYFDTSLKEKPTPMLHLDLREEPLIWFRVDHKYHYPNKSKFYKDLSEQFIIEKKSRERSFDKWI